MTLEPTALDAVRRPIEEARGLHNACYTDDEMFARERELIFKRTWSAVGLGQDVPAPGDARPIQVLGMPLLLLRDGDGVVRVFHNVCRHRGMQLVTTAANVGRILRCPYHAWCYGLDGQLRSTPNVGGPGVHEHPAIRPGELALQAVRSHVWRDVVFVDLSGEAPAFEMHVEPLAIRWRAFEQPLFAGGADSNMTLEIAANWKLLIENTSEAYHLPTIHPGLNSYSRLEDHYAIAETGLFSGQGTSVYSPALDGVGRGFRDFGGLSARWENAAEYISLYPNVQFGVHRDHAFVLLMEPLAPGLTRERVALYFADAEMSGPAYGDMRAALLELWRGIFLEDLEVVEGMQRGRHAPAFDGGRFSPAMEAPTHNFHRWIADRLEAR